MAAKITIDVFKTKNNDELTKTLAQPGSKLETGSGVAVTASVAAALLCRAAQETAGEKGGDERIDYIVRNSDIIRGYMVHLIDEDVKSRVPLNRALKEGEERNIEAARHVALNICAEIVNMMSQLIPMAAEIYPACPRDSRHYLSESVTLALASAETAAMYILDMSSKCSDETYRFITKRENEITLKQCRADAEALRASFAY